MSACHQAGDEGSLEVLSASTRRPRRDPQSVLDFSDARLVSAARARETWAQQALFMRHAPMALGLAHRFLPRVHDTDDLVQDCFLYAFCKLDSLENPNAFGSWLGTILVRTPLNRISHSAVPSMA